MTFDAKESSRYQGNKAEFYLFQYGPGATDYYAYTTAEQEVTKAGLLASPVTFVPTTIDRDPVNVTGNMDKTSMPILVPQDSPVAELYSIYPPSYVVALTIFEAHVDDPDADWKVVWLGRIIGATWEESQARLAGEPISTSMRRPGLRRRWQYGCQHALYGTECGANKVAATATVTVTSVDGVKLVLPSGWATPERKPKYLNGTVKWTAGGLNHVRRIVRVDATTNTLSCGGVLTGLAGGATVTISLGCNHQMDDCKDLHANIVNFGGDPWIPSKTPFGFNNNFY